MRQLSTLAVLILGPTLAAHSPAVAQSGLQITYGNQGVERLVYRGTVLEDIIQHPGDAFHIWHLKVSDLNGNPAKCSQCGWGESNNGRSWNSANQTWTYSFVWGTISVNFQQLGDTLNMNVTETNLPNSGYILDGASIYPFVLNFPALPAGFADSRYPQYAFETAAPGVTTADWGSGEVVSVVPDSSKPLYSGFQPTGARYAYTPFISGTTPDGIAVFLPHNDRPVQPGKTDTFTVSLRFAPSKTPTSALARDAYKNWASNWPAQLNWTDRRAIGTAYLASSPSGDPTRPGGYPNNPRRYFNNSNPADFDVTTPEGLQKFQAKVLQQAASVVANLKALNGQGVITWDIEGEQYPQATSYVCSPDQIAEVAPEMESTVSDTNSPLYGMKLDDAYFKIITTAGFRVGVCIRPQQFTVTSDGTAQQVYLPASMTAAQLIRKMKFAHSRWGATLFYVDSTVEANGAILDASIFQQVAAAVPDALIIPEESTPKYYAYTAPFLTFIFHGDLGTDSSLYNYYPRAFSANLINDVPASTLAANFVPLTASVKGGDILMGHADYAQANIPTIRKIYEAAGVSGEPPPNRAPAPNALTRPVSPEPVTPHIPVTITSPADSASISGIILVTGEINVPLDLAGSYLMVDGAQYGTYRAAQPPYVFPLDTNALANGPHTLQIGAHDTANTVDLSQPIAVSVANVAQSSDPPTPVPPTPLPSALPTANSRVVITFPPDGSTVSGAVSVDAQITATLDSAGSYLIVDGVQLDPIRVSSPPYVYSLDTTLLPNGTHSVQIWAHDTSNSINLSPVVLVTTAN